MAGSSTSPLKDNSTQNAAEENIVWIDLELTGLDLEQHHIIEVACLVTDSQLNIIAEGPNIVIYQPNNVLENMNEWSKKHHAESGLLRRCQESKVSLREAENLLLDFVKSWTPFKKCPLAGNCLYIDRFFLMKYMPDFNNHFHYRIIDVSSVKELCRRWYPEIFSEQPSKKGPSKHQAMYDIKASINELKFYKDKIFQKP